MAHHNEFQFQTGAIKSLNDGEDKGLFYASFNSKLVRLKVPPRRTCPARVDTVSIPNWCD